MRAVYLALACLIVAGEARAQEQTPQSNDIPATVFRTGVDLVALNVVVTDAQQKFVTGLSVDNFAVFDDGVRQELSFFAARDVPLDLALLLDTSASMVDKMATMQEAAIGFAATIRPGDRLERRGYQGLGEDHPGARTRTRSGYQAPRAERVVATIQK